MATKKNLIAFVTVLFLLAAEAPSSESLSYAQYRTLFSLSHALLERVANVRASRGDFAGAERARRSAAKLESASGLGFWRVMGSASWDYIRYYAWRDLSYSNLLGLVSDSNELLGWVAELTRTESESESESESERVAWLGRNYGNVLRVSKSMLGRLLKVFSESGTLRDIVVTVQREVVDGELLRDCLELGTNDLKGLIQILKDLALQYASQSEGNTYTDL